MSRAMITYFAVAVVLWIPTAFLIRRRNPNAAPLDLLVTALVAATGWPVTVPVLAISVLRAQEPERAGGDVLAAS